MFWDILIAVGAGLSQLLLAWMAWHVTVTPPPESRRHVYGIAFGAIGITGIFLIGVGAWRNSAVQEDASNVLTNISSGVTKILGLLDRSPSSHETASMAPTNVDGGSGPITWRPDFALVVTGGGPNALINALIFYGVSSSTVQMKDAYVVSELTGHKEQLKANIPYGGGEVPLDQIEPIPPGAPIDLVIDWKPPLSISNFLDQWGKIHFTAIYGDTTYDKLFDEDHIRQKIFNEIQGSGGPMVTKKNGGP